MRPLPTWIEQPSISQLLSRTTLTKWQLFNAFSGNGNLIINGKHCYLSAMQREDGSGSSFNLVISYNNQKYNCYCRTTD